MTIAEIISIAIALIALFVTLYQITLSNRHQLFDKRITNYKLFVRLLEIYAHVYSKIKVHKRAPKSA